MDSTTQELIESLRQNPEDVAAYERLKAHYLAHGDLASAANLIEGWGARRQDPLEASQAYVEAAQLVAETPDEASRFVSLLELALTLHPGHVRAHELLHRHYVTCADADGWIASLERRRDNLSRAAGSQAQIAELEFQLGEAWARHGRRVDRAALHYRAAYELDPTHVASLYAARQIYLEAGNIKAATRLLELEAKAERDAERKLALYHELQLRRERDLGDLPGAIEAARVVLSLEPSGARADERRRWLAESLLVEGHVEEAMRALAPLVDAGDESACRKIVELSETYPDLDAPLRVPALGALARLYESEQRLDAAAAVLERLFRALEDPELRIPVADKIARLALESGDRRRAIRALSEWAALDSADLQPRRRLVPLLHEDGPTDQLLDVLRSLVDDPRERPSYEHLFQVVARELGHALADDAEKVVDAEEVVDDAEEVVDAEEVDDAEEVVDDVEEVVDDAEEVVDDVEEVVDDAEEVVDDVEEVVDDAEVIDDAEDLEREPVESVDELVYELSTDRGAEPLDDDVVELLDDDAIEIVDAELSGR
jgi:tetratricopeptide (TPR) repeat protein